MSGQSRRALMFVSNTSGHVFCDVLRQHEWDVVELRSASQLGRYLARRRATVGVFDFASGYSVSELENFRPYFLRRELGWVGLLSTDQLNEESSRTILRSYFARFVTLPCEMGRFAEAVDHEHRMAMLADVPAGFHGQGEIVGACKAMQDLFRSISKVSKSEASVLVSGESGTGKELTAAAIHKRSTRRNGPFVAINCGALAHHLAEATLFGYERGAFTGAFDRKIGRVESANGGTLFLDEIADLPLESQTILLRFLQDRKIHRLGGTDQIDVDVRIISAVNVSLEKAVAKGAFRADLYHRLRVLSVEQPPLRARGTDIPLLAYHVLDRYITTDGRRLVRAFSQRAIKAMYTHSWPGNVRELINRIRRAIVMGEGRVITAADLELDYETVELPATLAEARAIAERQIIEQALMRHGDRPHRAARELGISRATIYRLMENRGSR